MIAAAAVSAILIGRLVATTGSQVVRQPKDLPTILELGSRGCASCDAMNEVVARIERDVTTVQVKKIDVFREKSAMDRFKLRVIPTQIIQDSKGNEVFRNEGFISYGALLARLKSTTSELGREN